MARNGGSQCRGRGPGPRSSRLTGYPPGEHDAQSVRLDYTALDRLIPHPAYAAQAWVAILNPGEATAERARSLLTDAHALAARRHDRRRG